MITDVFERIIDSPCELVPGSSAYETLGALAKHDIANAFAAETPVPREFWNFGQVSFPYHQMGAVSSLDLFGLDELILFAFYWQNRNRYRKVIDIGANIGLHSIILARCGFSVRAFEPDPRHYERLKANLAYNAVESVEATNAAVSIQDGTTTFVRVLGNTTGSHLQGAKESFGDREEFEVQTHAIEPLFGSCDLIKMDAEGHERELLLSLRPELAKSVDIVVEIGSPANAQSVFEHMAAWDIKMFSQKSGWSRVTKIEQMPVTHREGSLFVTAKDSMPWA